MDTPPDHVEENPAPAPGVAKDRTLGQARWQRILLPLAVLMTLVGTVGMLWASEVERSRAAATIEARTQVNQLARRAADLIDAELDRARGMARELSKLERADSSRFSAAIDRWIKPSPAIRAVGWIGRGTGLTPGKVVDFGWSNLRLKDDILIKGADLKTIEPWGYALSRAIADRAERVASVERRDSRVELWVITPVISGEGTARGYHGSVGARIDLSTALHNLEASQDLEGHDIRIVGRGMPVYTRGASLDGADERIHHATVPASDIFLQLSHRVPAATAAARRGSERWILWAGMPVAVGVSLAVWQALARRARIAAEARWQLTALEELTRAAGAVSTDMVEGTGALDQLAGSARRLLGMKMASISLVDLSAERVELVARDGLEREHRTVFTPDESRGTMACFNSGQTLVVEDTRTDPRVNPAVLAELYGVVSVILIPLVVGQKPIGVMYLGNDKPRRYTATEVRLANVLGAQAGVFLAILKLLREKEEAFKTQQQLSAQRESLYQIVGEIYRTEDLVESLGRLADAAPAVIGVELCVVCLKTGRGNEVQIYAVTRDFGGVRGERHDVSGSHIEDAWAARDAVVVENGPVDARLLSALRHRLHMGSVAFLPLLRTDGKPIGIMALIRSKPSVFTKEQLELGTVLAARAATSIEKARLYASARRLASSQETLLRELNHRVKNNLSSIVTLLQVNRPRLSEDAMRWLNRVTGRVATMARTHDLFVGGAASVSLGVLVSKLLPSLSVVKPPGAHVSTDLEAAETRLATDRAVSLAMVLNELCWNALEHGVGETGTLELRARRSGEGRLVLEVEDDGGRHVLQEAGGSDNARAEDGDDLLPVRRERGMGLRLVEGLVSRELGGKFALLESGRGGTLARVEMPILDEGGNSEETAVADSVTGRLS